ncbi:MAG: acylphosphatase [Betaproteobacteria bacterium]|nr:acylphosphatase [Betaproteobacteria bacterium]
MSDSVITVHLEITGRVQGVGFRESMRAVAQALEVNGWVRNRDDDSVEAIVQGAEPDVERLIAWCHNGPPGAYVRFVKADLVESSETFIAFTRWPNTRPA